MRKFFAIFLLVVGIPMLMFGGLNTLRFLSAYLFQSDRSTEIFVLGFGAITGFISLGGALLTGWGWRLLRPRPEAYPGAHIPS